MIEFPLSEPFYDEYGNVSATVPWGEHELQFVTYANLMGAGQLVTAKDRSGVPFFLSPLYQIKIPTAMGWEISSRMDSIEFIDENGAFGYAHAYLLFEAIAVSAISTALINSNLSSPRRAIFEMLEDCIGRRPALNSILEIIGDWK